MKSKLPAVFYVLMILSVLNALMSAMLAYRTEQRLCIISLCSAALQLFLLAAGVIIFSRGTIRTVAKLNRQIENSAGQYIVSMPAPVAILNSSGTLLWYNQVFGEKIALEKNVFGTDIGVLLPLSFG